MSIDWSTYKITLLLYIGILLFPIGFYFSYSAFSEIQADTKVLNTLMRTSSSLLLLDKDISAEEKNKLVKSNDKSFESLRSWMQQNNSKKFYVGSEPLLKEYDSLVGCWNNLKNSDNINTLTCYKKSKSLIFSIENMLKLKQSMIYNIFYINLFIAMAILITLIFFTRAYIYQQLKKHAIYDLKTNLYTKDYLLATIKEVIAKSTRTKEGLSALYINVDELKNRSYKKDKILEYVGTSLLNSLRVSDIACRYSEHEFIIILPNTQEEHFEILTNRINKNLSNISCIIKAVEYKIDESNESFLTRVLKGNI